MVGKFEGGFMKKIFLVGCFLILAVGTQANAADCIKDQYGNVTCGKGQCATDQSGKVFCARDGGGAMRDQYGDVKCGVGYCATDDLGQIKCSRKPGGGAATDSYGKVKCLGGCESATQQLCEVPR
jgi:hypothetical protein